MKALTAKNIKFTDERMKDDLERKKLQEEICVLKEENQKLQDEKLQMAYNYGLNIIQNLRLYEKVAKASKLASRLQEEMTGYKAEIARLPREV